MNVTPLRAPSEMPDQDQAEFEELCDSIAALIGKTVLEQENYGHTAFIGTMGDLTEGVAELLHRYRKIDRARFYRKSWMSKWMGLA